MKKIRPVVDTITDFIPGVGDTVDKVYDVISNVADKGGSALQSIGQGENVIETIKKVVKEDKVNEGISQERLERLIEKDPHRNYKPPLMGNELLKDLAEKRRKYLEEHPEEKENPPKRWQKKDYVPEGKRREEEFRKKLEKGTVQPNFIEPATTAPKNQPAFLKNVLN